MSKAILVERTGGPDVMRWQEVPVRPLEENQVLIDHSAVGLNYIDVYFRTGLYPAPHMPFTPGMEAAGVVAAVGPGVYDFAVGDRVAYAAAPLGAYCERRVMPADRVVKIPDAISDQTAAAMMLKGMTVEYLLRRTYRVKAGDTILFHAAAGGVGLIACQWARHLGATVLGTVSSREKADLVAAHGCDHPIIYTREDVPARVRALTHGEGVAVVYDSVGRDTWAASLDCLQPLGMMVSFGQSSGPIPPFEIATLSAKGSLFLTRPSLLTYNAKRRDLLASAAALFDVVEAGAVRIEVGQTYPLSNVVAAHRALEGRETTGSTVLTIE